MNPRGIVFVPKSLENLEIDPDVEFICSRAFSFTKITSLRLSKIFSFAFYDSNLRSIIFEEGTDLDTLGRDAFKCRQVDNINLMVIGKMYKYSN